MMESHENEGWGEVKRTIDEKDGVKYLLDWRLNKQGDIIEVFYGGKSKIIALLGIPVTAAISLVMCDFLGGCE